MGISFVSVKCPDCGATLEIENNRQQAFCTYCGTKVIIHNDRERTYRYVDEAEVKNAETERIVRLKQLEFEEKQREEDAKTAKLKIKIASILAVIGVLMAILGCISGFASGDSNSPGYMIGAIGLVVSWSGVNIMLFSKNDDHNNE